MLRENTSCAVNLNIILYPGSFRHVCCCILYQKVDDTDNMHNAFWRIATSYTGYSKEIVLPQRKGNKKTDAFLGKPCMYVYTRRRDMRSRTNILYPKYLSSH